MKNVRNDGNCGGMRSTARAQPAALGWSGYFAQAKRQRQLCVTAGPLRQARGENCAQLPVSQERMLLWLPCRTEGEKHVCSSLALGVFFQRLSSRHADPGFSADSVNSDIMVVVRRIKRSTVIYLKLT